ncbi:zinc-binding dehydrogenase [Nocardia sp. CA-119907]|uniref:zinc-binding dehydrogenase n=1 Tax=Nocardia sp. CA-119907 TaxID=3239973 RepID=UPI003D96F722
MQAITISTYGAPEVLTHTELPDPIPAAGEILIAVEAFGLNHAETYMRAGTWGDVAAVPGIEAAGTVLSDPDGRIPVGAKVIAIMGGMGRTRNGSYAELVTVPAANVVPVTTTLDWTELAAVPEVYATAWTALTGNLGLRSGDVVLVRGATSALGQAAVNLAADLGATVVATTRNPARTALLTEIGADHVLIDDGDLTGAVYTAGLRVDRLLDVVGNSVLRDSLTAVRAGGRVCQIGFLGGLDPVDAFAPIADLPSAVQLSFLGSFLLGTPEFPLSAIPFDNILTKVAAGTYRARPVRTFGFGDIVTAHQVMEAGSAGGKMSVRVAHES